MRQLKMCSIRPNVFLSACFPFFPGYCSLLFRKTNVIIWRPGGLSSIFLDHTIGEKRISTPDFCFPKLELTENEKSNPFLSKNCRPTFYFPYAPGSPKRLSRVSGFAADQSRIGEMWTASKKLAVLAVSHVGDSLVVKVKKSCATIHQ